MTGMFYFGCDFLYTAVRIWGTWQLVEAVSRSKWSKKIQNAVWIIMMLILSGFNAYNDSVIRSLFSNGSLMIIVLSLSFLSSATYDCRYREVFCMIFLLWTGLALADFFFQTIACMALTGMGLTSDIFLTATPCRSVYLLLCSALFYAAARFGCRWVKGKDCETGRYLKWGWFLIPLLFLCMVYFQRIYKLLIPEQMMRRWWLFLEGNLLAVLIIGMKLLIQREKESSRLLKLEIDMLESEYQELLQSQEEKKILQHDIKRHMQVICGMAEEEWKQGILCYMDDINGVLQKDQNMDLANHRLLNLILNQKSREARNAGISPLYEMADMGGLLLKPTEICALFSNILDNAIEANRKNTEDMERWIKLTCIRREQMLVVFSSNPTTDKELKYVEGIPQTTKQDKSEHGLGMRSIRQVVNMHDGHMLMEIRDGIFSLTICLKGF